MGVGRLVREKAVDVEDLLFDRKINWRSLKSQGDPEGRGTFYFFFNNNVRAAGVKKGTKK